MKQISRLHLMITLRQDVPQYVIDFFEKGIKHDELPSVLYSYDFTFDNIPNFEKGTFMLFEKVGEQYFLQIEHQFDSNHKTEACNGYWFTGGLGQYAEDSKMAGYIVHHEVDTQLFGYKEKVVFWHNNVLV
jgi:hypothetical protein